MNLGLATRVDDSAVCFNGEEHGALDGGPMCPSPSSEVRSGSESARIPTPIVNPFRTFRDVNSHNDAMKAAPDADGLREEYPWRRTIGMFDGDPDWEGFLADVEEARQEANERELLYEPHHP